MTQAKKKIILLTTGLILTICLMAFFGVYALTILKNSTFNVGVKYEPEYLVKVEMGIDGANGGTVKQKIEENEYVEIFNSLNPVSNGMYIDSMSNDTIHINSQTLTPIGVNGDVYFRITSLKNATSGNKDLRCVIDCGSATADSGKLVINTPKDLIIATGINATSGTATSSSLGMIKINLKFSEFVLDFVDLKDLDSNSSDGLNFGELGTIKHSDITGKTFYVSNIDGLLKLSALVGQVSTTTEDGSNYGSKYGYNNSKGPAVTFEKATIQMLNNIDCENGNNKDNFSKTFIPIGNETNSFQGIFDGNNKTITGLYINQTTSKNSGLFGYVYNAEIKDLTMQNCKVSSITLYTNQTSSLTKLFGYVDNTEIKNLKMQSYKYVTIPSYNVGNFVGNANNAIISNCNTKETEVSISAGGVGGIVGITRETTIINCHNKGNVNGDNAGGIVGVSASNSNLIITNCSNTGNVTDSTASHGDIGIAIRTNLGGIVGIGNGIVTIINSYNSGNVGHGMLSCGGIIGYINDEMAIITIINCYNTAELDGGGLRTSGAGGIVGCAYKAKTVILNNCYNSGLIEGLVIGGIVGSSQQGTTVTITNCYYLKTDSVNASLDAIDSGTATEGSYYGTFNDSNIVELQSGMWPSDWGLEEDNQLLITVLRAYIDKNSTYTDETSGVEIALFDWEIRPGENGGYPVFAL